VIFSFSIPALALPSLFGVVEKCERLHTGKREKAYQNSGGPAKLHGPEEPQSLAKLERL